MIFQLPEHCVEFDLYQILPVRKAITRSKRTGRGKVADVRHECTLKAESNNEFHAWRLIVAIAQYLRCVVQPFTLKFKFNGKFRRYTPDSLLLPERIVVEVKSDEQAAKLSDYFRFIRTLLKEHGYKFVVWTRSEIMQEPRLNNVGIMLKYRLTPISQTDRESAKAAFGNASCMSFAELSRRSGVPIQVLCGLVLDGSLFVDWFSPFGTEPLVSDAPIGRQVWPAPGADFPSIPLDDKPTQDCGQLALDEHAIAAAKKIIESMSVHSTCEAKHEWWSSRTKRRFSVQCRA